MKISQHLILQWLSALVIYNVSHSLCLCCVKLFVLNCMICSVLREQDRNIAELLYAEKKTAKRMYSV